MHAESWMRLSIRVISLAGLAIFAFVLTVTIAAPERIESAARSFVVAKVREELKQRVDRIPLGDKKEAITRLRDRWSKRTKEMQVLKDGLAARIADIVARLCHYDCAERDRVAGFVKSGMEESIKRLRKGARNLKAFAQKRYSRILGKLVTDLRIFSGANLAIFLCLFAATFLRQETYRPLLLPSALMLVATVSAASIYIFGQNWFFTIVFAGLCGLRLSRLYRGDLPVPRRHRLLARADHECPSKQYRSVVLRMRFVD